MDTKETVLVVDDDREIVGAIALALEKEGYRVLRAYDGMEALDHALDPELRLILMDVMMPRLDGLSAVLRIRERRNLPIIVLSAKSEESDTVLGLSMGADDYVTKPFSTQELVARVRSQLRRYTRLGDVNASARDRRIVNGRLSYDPDSRVLTADGDEVKLTATELGILDLLMCNLGRVFPAEEIYRRVWGEEAYASENTVMVHIRRIREKIELNPREPDYLKVVWGIGYKMEKHPSQRQQDRQGPGTGGVPGGGPPAGGGGADGFPAGDQPPAGRRIGPVRLVVHGAGRPVGQGQPGGGLAGHRRLPNYHLQLAGRLSHRGDLGVHLRRRLREGAPGWSGGGQEPALRRGAAGQCPVHQHLGRRLPLLRPAAGGVPLRAAL